MKDKKNNDNWVAVQALTDPTTLPLFYQFFKDVNVFKVASRRKHSKKHNSDYYNVGYRIKPNSDLFINTNFGHEG